jgi:DUF4097 and DUF4098 domain-containing protein YvlB
VEQSFGTPHPVLVFVHSEVGLIAITAHRQATSDVSLSADTPGGKELIGRATVVFRPRLGRDVLIVKVPRQHGMKFLRRDGVSVHVHVPEESDVRVISASADVELNGSLGRTNVKTASGAFTADDVADLRAKTASGDIEVDTVIGALRMQSAAGDLRCVRVDGPASVTTVSGDIEIGSAGAQLDVRLTSGDIRLGEVTGDLTVAVVSGNVKVLSVTEGTTNIRTVSGRIEVGVARGSTLHLDAESMSGSVHSDIPLEDGPSAGGADPRIDLTLRTVSGDVLVTRGVEAFAR